MNICEEYKTERKARDPNRTERDDRITRPSRAQACELRAKRAMRKCPRSGQILLKFFIAVLYFKRYVNNKMIIM